MLSGCITRTFKGVTIKPNFRPWLFPSPQAIADPFLSEKLKKQISNGAKKKLLHSAGVRSELFQPWMLSFNHCEQHGMCLRGRSLWRRHRFWLLRCYWSRHLLELRSPRNRIHCKLSIDPILCRSSPKNSWTWVWIREIINCDSFRIIFDRTGFKKMFWISKTIFFDIFWLQYVFGFNLQVTSPEGAIVHALKGTSGEKFEFKAPQSGTYKFCFNNPVATPETVSFYIHVGHIPNEYDLAKDGQFNSNFYPSLSLPLSLSLSQCMHTFCRTFGPCECEDHRAEGGPVVCRGRAKVFESPGC